MAFPTTPILDAFTRANAGTLGANWTTIFGGQNFRIVSNQAKGIATSGYCTAAWNVTNFGPDLEAYVDLVAFGATWTGGLYIRYGGGGPSAYNIQIGPGYVNILVDLPSETLVTSGSATWTAGDKLGVRVVGTKISVYQYTSGAWNQTPILSTTDTQVIQAGRIAFWEFDNDGNTIFDNFGGGTYRALPPHARRAIAQQPASTGAFFP